MRRIFLWIVVVVTMLPIVSCGQKSKLKDDIERLEAVPIILPLKKMKRFCNTDTLFRQNSERSKFRFVVFSDSLSCSSCKLSQIHFWDDLLDEMQEKAGVEVYFIFAPPKEEQVSIELTLSIFHGRYNAYLDTAGVFLRENRNVPTNPALHSFLLDEEGNVLLVGDPVRSKKLRKMLWKILDKEESE